MPTEDRTSTKLAYVRCILCGQDNTRHLFKIKGFSFVQCKNDDLIYINPRLADEQLESIYDQTYYANPDFYQTNTLKHFGYDRYLQDKENIKLNFQGRIRKMTDMRNGSNRLLDVGCAMGFLLEVAQEHGWEAEGIEICSFAAGQAKRNGLKVQNVNLHQLNIPRESLHAITMLDVIEHFGDPAKELARCNVLLKEGGQLVITTPDAGSLFARATGRHWNEMKKVLEHIYFFSRKTLRHLLDQKGFEVVRVETTGRIFELENALKMARVQCAFLAKPMLALVRLLGIGKLRINVDPRYKMTVYARKVRSLEPKHSANTE